MQRLGLGRCAEVVAAGGCYASEVQSYCFFAEYANFLSMYFCSGVLMRIRLKKTRLPLSVYLRQWQSLELCFGSRVASGCELS